MSAAGTYREHVEQVRAAHEIKAVIGRYIQLSDNNTAACPFHKESRPSFSVNTQEGYFHCFGCKVSGDSFKFVELMEGKTFGQAVDLLAEWAGIPSYRAVAQSRDEAETERAILNVTEAVARYYHSRLNTAAVEYFVSKRKLPKEFLEQFMIGWADGQACTYIGQAYGSPWLDIMKKAGLALEVRNDLSWTGGIPYRDLLVDRLVFPMFSRKQPVYLSGRALDDREPKYLHQKGRDAPLYNEDAIGPEVYVTEGPFDALSLVAWGYNTVALNGSILKPWMIQKLQRAQRIYLALDGDRAGFQATMSLAAGLYPRSAVVSLPEGLDPSDFYCQRSKDEFDTLVGQAMDPGRYAVERVPKNTPKERLGEALAPLFSFLVAINPMAREAYLEKVVERFKLTRDWLKRCREEVELAARGHSRCPACGTMLTARVT